MINSIMSDMSGEEKEKNTTYPMDEHKDSVIVVGEYKLQCKDFFKDYYKSRRSVLRIRITKDWILCFFFFLFGMVFTIAIIFLFNDFYVKDNGTLILFGFFAIMFCFFRWGWLLGREGYRNYKTFRLFSKRIR